jgi:hypothetical protein
MKPSENMVKTIAELDKIIKRLKEISNNSELQEVFHDTGARYEIVEGGNNLVQASRELSEGLADQMIKEMNL